jgi:AcrR family transcriptional regulator
LGREKVAEVQRARILAAMVDVVAERGIPHATVARVVARSGVSRRTFYEFFEGREECFLAAFDESVARIAAVVLPAYRQSQRWLPKMRSALIALLEFLDYDRGMGRLVIVEALGAGSKALERRRLVLVQVIAAVDLGQGEIERDDDSPSLTAEGVVGGVLALIHARLLDGEGTPLVELAGTLMSMIALPYLGPAAARRELERPAPTPRHSHGRARTEPLRELDIRLTYRTMLVLLAIGGLGGRRSDPSNRQVADAAGIRDQGQISKLLARLEHLGLIENAAHPQVKGEPNAWKLTLRGVEVREAIERR